MINETQADRKLRLCTGKKKIPLMSTAMEQAAADSKRTGDNIAAYDCEFCGSMHVGHSREVPQNAANIDSLLLAKIMDDQRNMYVFAIPAGTTDKDADVVLEFGRLIAFKKGKDEFKEKGGRRSFHWKTFLEMNATRIPDGELIEGMIALEKHMDNMMDISQPKKQEVPTPAAVTTTALELAPEHADELTPMPNPITIMLKELVTMSSGTSTVNPMYFMGYAHAKLTELLNC